MRTFAIGDIHGGLKGLVQLMNQLKITAEDTLIFVGDYVDGWSESAQVIDFLINLSEKTDCVFIKGNHDVWCEDWLQNGTVNDAWYQHGGKETIESYKGFTELEKKKHLQFFKNMPIYHIDQENRLFLHAGFTSLYGVERELHEAIFYTDRSLWEMLTSMDQSIDKSSIFYPKRIQQYTEIYIGHTPTTNYGKPLPMNIANVWNIDTGAAFKGKISAINIDTKAIFQSDALPSLYPNEKGRNK